MFCYQCEQTTGGKGCTHASVSGKDPTAAALQDLIVYAVKGISTFASRAARLGRRDRDIDVFVVEALFATVTNVDFDPDRLQAMLDRAYELLGKAKGLYEAACLQSSVTMEWLEEGAGAWVPAAGLEGLVQQGEAASITARIEAFGEDVAGVQELILYGLKGAAAYADHALILGKESEAIFDAFHDVLAFLAADPADLNELLAKALAVGELNLRVMELLDAAHTETYGHPEPTAVNIEPVKGKAVLISGHDLKDLHDLLEQTKDKGINVYTHGEMLPAHSYPKLKAYPHLVGNYGGAWQDQQKEFEAFPGAVLMTTNCIIKPRESYKGRIFTNGLVAWPGVRHIRGNDFAPVIEAALEAPGFADDAPARTITVGFGHNAVLGVADKVVEAVKAGAIKHFFLVGGCDGARPGRNYYTEFAEAVPADCVILTLACGKYRFNKMDFGDIGGIPRLLDMGQCNDAHSAIRVAVALSEAFGCGVNDLPLSLILSWFEQKAVAILLSLLHLGIRGIRLGPSLPAFVSPAVLNVLVEKFDIKPIGDPQEDLKAILAS